MADPIGNRIRKRVGRPASKVRNTPGRMASRAIPQIFNSNFGKGRGAAAVASLLANFLDDAVGLPFGASVETYDVRDVNGTSVYTIDVNAPTEKIAESRAFINATAGFASYFTESFKVEADKINTFRVARDTYRVEVIVQE